MIYALVEYKNGKGKIIVKGFGSQEDLVAFLDKLDRRIEKGTCLGYIATLM